jgi:hypothetical protein
VKPKDQTSFVAVLCTTQTKALKTGFNGFGLNPFGLLTVKQRFGFGSTRISILKIGCKSPANAI